jgi:hypothetical protein
MDYGGQSWIHHLAAKDLLQRPGQARVFFTVNNEALIMPLAQLCARRVFQMPLPKYYGEIPEPRHAGAGAPVIYVHLNMRSGVMLDQVEPAIHTVLDQYPHAKFLLKYCKNALEPAADGRLSDALSARGVELVPSEQSHADHIRTIARSDIVFLPYEATEYTALASGVFAEATALGKVNVYPANTWMAEQVARGHAAGVGFAAANHRETSAAVVRALDSLTELSSLAVARSHAFRALHSCGRNLDLMLVLAAEEQDMSLRFIPGKPIRFDQPFQSRSHLGRGWSSFEPVGIWTDAAIAELNFYSGPRPAGAFDVHFSLTPFFSKGRPQQVTISVGGVELCRWDFPDHQERAASWRRVTVPLHLMTDGRIRMQLRVKDPHSPKQIGMSEDPRELGIMLHEMRLDYLESQMD